MKVIKYQLFIAAALLAGVAIGFFAGEPSAKPKQEEKLDRPTARPIADKGDAATVAALRHRIAELEKLLAVKGEASEQAISNAVAEAVKARPPEPPRQNFRERMEEMKKSDPERYAQTTNRFAQWRRSRAEQARNKIGFLSSVDTSRMSAGAKKTHDALQELIARRENIEAELQQENLTDERRGELMEAMRETHHEMMRLNAEERDNLFGETARALGFEGDDVAEITATIQDIIEATDGGFGPPRHQGGHRGPPPGGPQGGPRGR